MRTLVIVLGFLIGFVASAGIVKTFKPAGVELVNAKGELLGNYPDKILCEAAIPVPTTAGSFTYACKDVVSYETHGTCDDTPKPPLPTIVILDPAPAQYADPVNNLGVSSVFKELGTYEARLCLGSETEYCDVASAQVAADFPECWKTELVPVE